jgi:hypothetical protein
MIVFFNLGYGYLIVSYDFRIKLPTGLVIFALGFYYLVVQIQNG